MIAWPTGNTRWVAIAAARRNRSDSRRPSQDDRAAVVRTIDNQDRRPVEPGEIVGVVGAGFFDVFRQQLNAPELAASAVLGFS
ncbi:hypothetical protein ACTWPB_21245 [Nocardia sp. IBHARD005]|uniref:hypothetical protein n=1 Tax=Nocardia sp. IBHARD005 TaxID=3457765 RepID=UPI00405975FB